MDYVLFGMGYGATLMLLGWALRTFGPERKYKDIQPEDIDSAVKQRYWVRFVQGLGGVIAITGSALVVLTFIVMLVNPEDDTGALALLVACGFLIGAVLAWCWLYCSQFGIIGIWSRAEGYGLRSSPATSTPPARRERYQQSDPEIQPSATAEPALALEPEPGSSSPEREPEGMSSENDPEAEERERISSDELDPESPVDIPGDMEAAEVIGAEYDFGDGDDVLVPSELPGRSEAIRRLQARKARTDTVVE